LDVNVGDGVLVDDDVIEDVGVGDGEGGGLLLLYVANKAFTSTTAL